MNLVLIVFANYVCRSIARDIAPRFIYDMFLEKAKLKDDSSNDVDWVRNLRIILIAAKKDYVLEAPLGEAPIPENQDVMNAWQQRADDYLIV